MIKNDIDGIAVSMLFPVVILYIAMRKQLQAVPLDSILH